MHELWQSLTHADIGLLEKVGRTIVVYVFLLVGLRLGGKRELGMLNPFDLVVLLVLSNTLQNAIIGPDNSLLGGLVGASVLLLLNYAVVKYLYRHPHLDRIVEGEALELVRDGRVLTKNMHKELITVEELKSRARLQGIEDLSTVKCARIEVGGALTFVQAHPTAEESFDRAVLRRLDRIERQLEAALPARGK